MNKDVNLRIFGSRLKEMRLKQNLTQAQLAEKIGVSTNFIGMVERGLRNTTIDKMFLLINALDTTLSVFFENL